ncbi:ABC transporter permease [Phycicoccus sonneratiae]|uniref:Transport permease protein n=1 Tax=Phycicoccus sonneratiae TaxID=2807628 RepID=A0ABS2CGA1_9MICO|nr:ABC transporter permease [Phycicoccus sonneraticus]MBM6398850.1 ABC transporter permease [Phycicoccus sonneraticus]
MSELVVQGVGGGLAEVARRRYLLQLLVRKELRVRYRASLLGLGWSYVKPAVTFAVYFVGLGLVLRQNSIDDYAVYLFGGLVVVTAFSEALGNATRSVVANGELVRKVFLPRELFPVASVCVAGVHLLPQLLVLVVGALVAGWRPDLVGLLALLACVVLTGLLATGLGLLLSAVDVLFRDVENVVDLVLTVLVWTSPVLYPTHLVERLLGAGSWTFALYQHNPLTVAVDLVHRATWAGASPANLGRVPGDLAARTAIAFVVAAALVVLGQAVFRRLSGRFAQEL